jgi:hypothetical protein
MFRNAPPETIGAKVIADVTGMETSYYTKDAYRDTITVILEKSVASMKTKEDLGMIALVRDLARAGGLSAEDLRMIYAGQRSVIANALEKGGSKVAMSEIEHLIVAQETEGFKLLIEGIKRDAIRTSIGSLGSKPKSGGKAGVLIGLGVAATLTIADSAHADTPSPDVAEGVAVDLRSIGEIKSAAISDDQKRSADAVSYWATLQIKWSLQDVYQKEFARSHMKESMFDWTMALPIGLGTFLSTSRNYEISPGIWRGEVSEALGTLEEQLRGGGVPITDSEREAIRREMEQIQIRAYWGR